MTYEETLKRVKAKGIKIKWNKKSPSITTCEGDTITISINASDKRSPRTMMIVLHEIYHAMGYVQKHRRYYMRDDADVIEEIAASTFAKIMLIKIGVKDEAVEKEIKEYCQAIANKAESSKQAAKKTAKYYAEKCVKQLEEKC